MIDIYIHAPSARDVMEKLLLLRTNNLVPGKDFSFTYMYKQDPRIAKFTFYEDKFATLFMLKL